MERVGEILSRFATPDFVVRREFEAGKKKGCVLFVPELSDPAIVEKILFTITQSTAEFKTAAAVIEIVLTTAETGTETEPETAVSGIMSGDSIIIFDGLTEMIVANTRSWQKRSVSEPSGEAVTRGPREGFTEDIVTNLSLLCRRLRTPDLAVERMTVGRKGNTSIAILYLASVAVSETVRAVKKKLSKIDIDSITDSSQIELFLEERPLSVFKQIGGTERPDVAANKICEGRVAVVVEGSPVVLTVPYLLIEDFHSAEDHYSRSSVASFVRVLRIFALLAAVILPGFYVALLQFHYDLAPLPFLSRLTNAAAVTPLPPLAEMLLVIGLFEIIREAAVRMPRIVSMAMSIVGAIVLGEAIVRAGIISSPTILIIAASSIALFTAPLLIGPTTLLRILFTVLGGVLGLYGLLLGVVCVIHYLAGIESYGSPFLAPMAPFIGQDQGDAVFKKPLFELKKRPFSVRNQNETRQS